jgi:DNA-binding transcriptional LysR family regulator
VCAKPINWDSRIGRRVRLRDLHILFAVVEHGSMAKAGAQLGMSQSAVSQAIAALEDALQVPLFDRTPRGADLTIYGKALMQRGQAAFDELRSGVKDIEFLTDPQVGEVRIDATEPLATGLLPPVIDTFSRKYPRVRLHVFAAQGYTALHDRTADIVLEFLQGPIASDLTEDLQAEVLFQERICLAASTHSPWARRRKINLDDLKDAVLISPSPHTPGARAFMEAFRTAGLPEPQITVTTHSVHVRNILSMTGRFIAVLPASVLRFNPGLYSLKELPFDLPMPPLQAVIVTLKNRTLSPPVERFIACAREVGKAMHSAPGRTRGSGPPISDDREMIPFPVRRRPPPRPARQRGP